MDERKAFGVVSALGKAIGEQARDDPGVLEALRKTESADALRAWLGAHAGSVPPALVEAFNAWLPDAQWAQWRARIVLQAKMVAAGQKPAPGHEKSGGFKGR